MLSSVTLSICRVTAQSLLQTSFDCFSRTFNPLIQSPVKRCGILSVNTLPPTWLSQCDCGVGGTGLDTPLLTQEGIKQHTTHELHQHTGTTKAVSFCPAPTTCKQNPTHFLLKCSFKVKAHSLVVHFIYTSSLQVDEEESDSRPSPPRHTAVMQLFHKACSSSGGPKHERELCRVVQSCDLVFTCPNVSKFQEPPLCPSGRIATITAGSPYQRH